MGVKVKERPPGSGEFWVFINHKRRRKALKVGMDAKRRRACGGTGRRFIQSAVGINARQGRAVFPIPQALFYIWRPDTTTPQIWGQGETAYFEQTGSFSTVQGFYPQFLPSYPQVRGRMRCLAGSDDPHIQANR